MSAHDTPVNCGVLRTLGTSGHDSSDGELPPNNGHEPTSGSNQDDLSSNDRLHEGRTAIVAGHEIATTVSVWLADLGAHSPLVEHLARAVDAGDWPAAHAMGEYLSVDVTVAACVQLREKNSQRGS